MSTGLNLYKSFDPQHQCKFFAAPAEIRYAIYAYLIPDRIHLSFREKRFRLSLCIQRDQDGAPNCINRQSNAANLVGDGEKDSIYARRLRSSWGSHWRCEEIAIQMEEECEMNWDNTAKALLLVCKRMFTDVAETIADTVAIEITEFDTLGILVSNSDPDVLASGRSCTSNLLGCVLPNLKELSISLRLSLATYEALENAGDSGSSKSLLISAWTELPFALDYLSRLRRLQIWLDHEEPCSWSVVNERAVLSPLVSLSSNPELDVSINLPKLHPKWEAPERHFTEDSPQLPIAIHRRYRQRYHGVEDSNANLCVKFESDFPICYEVADLEEWTIEEVEELERESWERGDDDPRYCVMEWQPTTHVGWGMSQIV